MLFQRMQDFYDLNLFQKKMLKIITESVAMQEEQQTKIHEFEALFE